MSEVNLFLSEEGEELYKKLKKDDDNTGNNSYAWHKNARERINDIYNRHARYLDKKFTTQFREDLFSCLWELKLLAYLEKNNSEKILPNPKGRPDFKCILNDKIYYIEATCVTPGSNDSYPYLNKELGDSLLVRDGALGHHEYRERLAGAFREKASCKYDPSSCDINICKHTQKSGYKDVICNDGYIIAISMVKINFFNQPCNWRVDLSCFFPCSPYMTMLINNNGQMQDNFHEYKPSFVKGRNPDASISVDIFANEKYAHVSAVLISHAWQVLFPDLSEENQLLRFGPSDNDFMLIHNPHALVPLKKGTLPVEREFRATYSGDKYTVNLL